MFDANPPMNTPAWINTLDGTPPNSHILAIPTTETSPNFTVSWVGTDVGSGIQDYTVYVSDNGGAFYCVSGQVRLRARLRLRAQVGHTYGFYSIARDLVGNVESKPSGRGGQHAGKRRAEPADGRLVSTAVRVAEFHRAWRANQSSMDDDHRS